MNRIVGFQITAKNFDALNQFYKASFGWEIAPGPHENVSSINTGNTELEGSIIGRGDFIPDYVSLFIETDDLECLINDCQKNGGTVIRPPFQLENGDQLAIIEDPEGHIITLINKA